MNIILAILLSIMFTLGSLVSHDKLWAGYKGWVFLLWLFCGIVVIILIAI